MACSARKTELSTRVVRAARLGLKTVVLMSRGTESIPTELEDISASGVRLALPRQWPGQVGETWVLDMILGEGVHLHLEADVARMDEQDIGLTFTWIPDEEQPELWGLLGEHADMLDEG